jgi:hypothetical protein
MNALVPTIGRIVHYRLSATDAQQINRRRRDAREHHDQHVGAATGVQIHVGNDAQEGEAYPMVITKAWGTEPTSSVNGQVMLDGNDLFWATSVQVGTAPGTFSWPARV